MFSKPIFKQTLKSSYRLWLIFTLLLCVLSSMIIAVYDPKMISSMVDVLKDAPGGGLFSDQLDNLGTMLGLLGQSFYQMQASIMPLIFIIITANSLIAAQVDRGSMAYLLSTPTKRSVVIRTQALYLIMSIFFMFFVITLSGLLSVQLFQGGLYAKKYTADVKAVSTLLNIDRNEIADHLELILANPEALEAGAKARDIESDVYTIYLSIKIANAAAQNNPEAAEQQQTKDTEMQNKIIEGFKASAELMKTDITKLDMKKLKANDEAVKAAVNVSGLPKEIIIMAINTQLANNEIVYDDGINFVIFDYFMLNLGIFLLMFATSGISFMFSCIFNLSKNSFALGAGIPIAFFLFQIMSRVNDSLSGFKYFTLNTLFDTSAIVSGGSYAIQFGALAIAGTAFYIVGMVYFVKKDLPL